MPVTLHHLSNAAYAARARGRENCMLRKSDFCFCWRNAASDRPPLVLAVEG